MLDIMGDTSYANRYRNIDFRKNPEKYFVGIGEQGVLMAEPYKSEILPYWRFAQPAYAEQSANKIYLLFKDYRKHDDFVGMDMSRKFLQMGFTRARRYTNHGSGKKYDDNGNAKPQDAGSEQSPKAESARIFYGYYIKAREDARYKKLKLQHKKLEQKQRS
ncbi:MAG: DUF4385 family protein [Patescibacteria group bacterium]|nr:DUF4385 family protein [Patescibacteria group bacterium]